jgi:hypothetical protein
MQARAKVVPKQPVLKQPFTPHHLLLPVVSFCRPVMVFNIHSTSMCEVHGTCATLGCVSGASTLACCTPHPPTPSTAEQLGSCTHMQALYFVLWAHDSFG